jgi:hypothetical protein
VNGKWIKGVGGNPVWSDILISDVASLQAALDAKVDDTEKGAASGVATLDANTRVIQKHTVDKLYSVGVAEANIPIVRSGATVWEPVPAGGADLSYDGDWVPGSYQDGDVVVKDGVTFLCVGGPTTTAPDPSLWGSLATQIPAAQNGKWLKGEGGAMVWDSPVGWTGGVTISGANTDLAIIDSADVHTYCRISTGGGSLRSIQPAEASGSLFTLQNVSASAVSILHAVAGGYANGGIWIDHLNGAGQSVTLPPFSSALFGYVAGNWLLLGVIKEGLYYGITLPPATPYDGQECILTDSLTNPAYAWRLRYNAASAFANKWEYIGGEGKLQQTNTIDGGAAGNSVWTSFGPNAGPSFTVPRSGVYRAEWGVSAVGIGAGTTGYVGLSVGGVNPATLVTTETLKFSQTAIAGASTLVELTVSAVNAIQMVMRDEDSTRRLTYEKRWLYVRPVRLS